MGSALRIVAEVVAFRVRRLEMANLAAAASLVVALRLPLGEAAIRVGFAALLNVLAYLTNDYYDVEDDLDAGRAPEKTRYLADHRRAALHAQLVLALLLAALAVAYRLELLVALVLGAGTCWLYSARLKRVAFWDVLAMAFWGAAMPLAAVPLDRKTGLALLGLLALYSAVFESIQVLRDREHDAARGHRTSAVALGPRRTVLLIRGFLLISAVYAALVLDYRVGGLIALGVFIPVADDVSRYWTRVRLLLGVVWVALLIVAT